MKIIDFNVAIKQKQMPINQKKIKKLGTLKLDVVESTPFVWKDELVIFEWIRSGWGRTKNEKGYYQIFNPVKNTASEPFGHEHAFGCAYEEKGIVYVYGVKGNGGWTNQLDMFWSNDSVHWHSTRCRDVCRYKRRLLLYAVCCKRNLFW